MKAYKVYWIVDFVFLSLFLICIKPPSLLSQLEKLRVSVILSQEYVGTMAGET